MPFANDPGKKTVQLRVDEFRAENNNKKTFVVYNNQRGGAIDHTVPNFYPRGFLISGDEASGNHATKAELKYRLVEDNVWNFATFATGIVHSLGLAEIDLEGSTATGIQIYA